MCAVEGLIILSHDRSANIECVHFLTQVKDWTDFIQMGRHLFVSTGGGNGLLRCTSTIDGGRMKLDRRPIYPPSPP